MSAEPATIRKPGFNGRSSVFEEVRDQDGKGKREDQFVETRPDAIGWLKRRGLIEEYQWAAGCHLQRLAEAAEIRTRSNPDGLRATRTLHALSDHQDHAMAAHADAKAAVRIAMGRAGSRGETLLRLVVIENVQLGAAAKIMRIEERSTAECLRFALDVLARHLGLA